MTISVFPVCPVVVQPDLYLRNNKQYNIVALSLCCPSRDLPGLILKLFGSFIHFMTNKGKDWCMKHLTCPCHDYRRESSHACRGVLGSVGGG